MISSTRKRVTLTSSTLLRLLTSSLHSSPRPSNPDRNFTTPRNPTFRTPRTRTVKPNALLAPVPRVSDIVSSSKVVHSICSLLSNQTYDQITNLDNSLQGFKEQLNSDLVLQVLMNYRHLGRIKTLEFFSWAGLKMGFQFDDSVVEYMADFLGRRKLFDDMKCLLVTVFLHKGRVSCRTISICIRFLGRQGRIKEALCLFREMESKFGCEPDNFVYNNMLYVLCKKEYSEELIEFALEVFKRIELPDKYSYSNIIVGLCKFGRFETALGVLDEMSRRAGVVPTRSAVNTLIGDLCLLSAKDGGIEKVRVSNAHRPITILVPNLGPKRGVIAPAIQVFWAVNKMGLLPSTFVIIRMISELCRLCEMQEAIKVLKHVENRKPSCVQQGYSIVMQALCENRRLEEVSDLFGMMISQGINPKLAVYNSIICMLCKLGNLDDAERVFKIMNKKRRLPNSVTYSAMIHGYGEAGNWETAYGLMTEMLGLGMSPHIHSYNFVDKLLRENGKMNLCSRLEMKLEAQSLQKLCKMGHLEAAYEKLESMAEKGFYPPIYVRDAFEGAFRKYGKSKVARELLEKIDKIQKAKEMGIRSSK